MFCPNCGTPNADSSRFCQRCGSTLPVNQPPTPPLQFAVTPPPRSRSGLWLALLVFLAIAIVAVTAIVVANQNGLFGSAAPPEEPAVAVLNNAPVQTLSPYAPAITPRPEITATLRPSATPTPTQIPTSTQTPTPTVTPSPTPCPDLSPYALGEDQMKRLGCPTQGFVASRVVVIQSFAKGVMVIFSKPINTFDNKGGAWIYALANDGRAWRMTDTYIETSNDPRAWYSCDVKSNKGPEVTGVPWRGFGKAWCAYLEVKAALGKSRTAEEGGMAASFQSYENGRAFQLSDWRGYPGWSAKRVYSVYLPATESDYRVGTWEAK